MGTYPDNIGQQIYELATELFPICRSITGKGIQLTLDILKRELPELKINRIPTGTRCFDWIVPDEWNIKDAYVIGPGGKKVIDFHDSNLHVVQYSEPVNAIVSLEELQQHLHSLPEIPDAIPYITSYYNRRWGFCLTDTKRRQLEPGNYQVVIDSTLEPGFLTYGELLIPGESKEEIFLSTYICHPSMANNELSGPTVTCYLAKWLGSLDKRKYSYRIIFIPETIGAIVYLSKNLEHLKDKVCGGFNVSCVGDDHHYSYLPSRWGNTLSDKVAKHVLKHVAGDFIQYSFLDRASDERQYCSPGVDLPICCILRSKYGTYPEYHTSLDNLSFISPKGLGESYNCFRYSIICFEHNVRPKATVLCEPQMGKRNLYPTLGVRENFKDTDIMLDLLAYADGGTDLLKISEIINQPMWQLLDYVRILKEHKLIELV